MKDAPAYSFLRSYMRGETLTAGWRVVGNILMLLNTFLLISYLDVFKYGVYLLAIAFYTLVAGFFLRPLQGVILNDVIRFIQEKREENAKKLFLENAIVRLSIALALIPILFWGADLAAELYDEDIAGLIRVLSPLPFIAAFYSSMRMLFQARLSFGLAAARPVVYRVFRLLLLGSFILFAVLGATEAMIAHVIASLIATIVFLPSFFKLYAPWRNIRATQKSVLWWVVRTHGKWSIVSQVFSKTLSGAGIRPWLIKFFVNTEAVAIFSVAESLFGAVKEFLPVRTLNAIIPREVQNKKRLSALAVRGVKYLVLLGVLLGSAAFFGVPALVKVLFPHYEASIALFQLLLVLLPILAFRSMGTTIIGALRRQKVLFFFASTRSVVRLVLALALLPIFGIWGMVYERIIVSVLSVVAIYWWLFTRELSNMPWRLFFSFGPEDKSFLRAVFTHFRSVFKRLMLLPGIRRTEK